MTDLQSSTRNAGLAGAIERDLLRPADDKSRDPFAECFSCGRGMTYRGSRFCSTRCREWFDAGNPSYSEQQEQNRRSGQVAYTRLVAGPPGAEMPYMPKPMRRGKVGFYIDCAYCQKEFESRGLRCCSIGCERRYREREDNLRVMAQVGAEPTARRQCQAPGCGAVIPKWRNGRKVSRATRFCSPKCSRRAQTADTTISTSKRARSAHKSGLESKPQNVLDLARAAIE